MLNNINNIYSNIFNISNNNDIAKLCTAYVLHSNQIGSTANIRFMHDYNLSEEGFLCLKEVISNATKIAVTGLSTTHFKGKFIEETFLTSTALTHFTLNPIDVFDCFDSFDEHSYMVSEEQITGFADKEAIGKYLAGYGAVCEALTKYCQESQIKFTYKKPDKPNDLSQATFKKFTYDPTSVGTSAISCNRAM